MDYTTRAAKALVTLFIAVVMLGAIPPLELFGLELRRVDLYSLFESSSDYLNSSEGVFYDNVEYDFDRDAVASQFEHSAADSLEGRGCSWIIDSIKVERNEALEASLYSRPLPLITDGLVEIEDFDTTATSALSAFYEKLLHSNSLVRIAVMGDSFVEGDILTSDLREMLQQRYGGVGAGFAPVSSPLTKFRRTIITNSKGWKSNNVMQRKNASAADVSMFTISGWLSRPYSGASVEWRMCEEKRGNEMARSARLLFVTQEDAQLQVEVNDGAYRRSFSFEGAEHIRHIDIEADSIYAVKLTLTSGSDGFAGYGAIFDGGSGVSLDNYSVRSNSGHAMFWSNASLNAQIGRAIGGYDLVVLQYGLNIMAQDVYNYGTYAERLSDMVEYVRGCFPGSAVLVMGVSERYVKVSDSYEPMNSIERFAQMQRSVAQECGAAFWPTHEAFKVRGGIPHFVEQGWAGKDYTHINFNGGREMGYALYDAINMGVYNYLQSKVEREYFEPILDETQRDIFSTVSQLRPLAIDELALPSSGIVSEGKSSRRWFRRD